MAELVVSMAIGPLVSMLRDKASSYLLDEYNVMEGMEEQHKTLKRKLPAILDVIIDAEEQATAHREGAKAWLQELKTVAYEANEVFDEFKYEALRREAKKKGHYRELGLDAFKLFPTHNRIMFRYKMSRKLCRILQAVEVLISEMHAFRFKYRPQPPVSMQWRKTDYVIVDPQEIASRSREKDKSNIINTLLHEADNPDLTVVPIIGMGGLVKTTLAQLIYNEPQIQKHFQLLLWVCVSDTFDVNSLAKSIVEASPKKKDDIDKPPLDRLQKLVNGQRYLLVLDDVWNNREFHKWERLKVCLQHGGTGSAVLTTTRDKRVAEIMGVDRAYHLNDLDDRFLKEIIEARAFSPGKEKPVELVKMVDEIVKRCSGSPLAATALGSVLRTKTSVDEWKAVLSRSSICTEETGILPILKLSYNDLPSHMKQCFAFCAVFPKDYKIDVEKLIQLWIANGFIPAQKEDSVETIGKHIFRELASKSFFQDIEESENLDNYTRTTCKIHDLMHDIAMFVMGMECVVATKKPSQAEWLPDTARHLFLSCKETEGILNDSMEKRSPAIQTLLCDSRIESSFQHLSKYNSLHALKLRMKTKSFLLKPKYLHHLRYLDLSGSDIKALPEDISILYNLQMLDISYCANLNRLPRKMKYMTSLCHLYTHGCLTLKSMPPELGKLTKLQTLTRFVAGVTGPDDSDVAELEHLNLCGRLELCQIENIDIDAEAKMAILGKKRNLTELTLRWTSVCDSEVLNNFQPHDGLQLLRIYSYGGKCVGMLQNMVEMHLYRCERLVFLFRCSPSFTFPKLKQLTLEDLLDLERWWDINEEHMAFPLLEKLFIRYCRKLVALPGAPLLPGRLVRSAFPALKVLEMKGLKSFQRWDATVEGVEILFPQLEELSIKECPKLIRLPESPLLQEPCVGGGYRLGRSAFPALKVLKMVDLETFQRWDAAAEGQEIQFPFLEDLSIVNCPKLIALPEAPLLQEPCSGGYGLIHSPFRLPENFFVRYYRKLTTLPEAPLLQEPCSRSYRTAFPALKVLNFFNLESFQRWDATVEGEEILFPHLENLSIDKCPKLTTLPKAPLLQEPCSRSYRSAFPALKVLNFFNLESFQRWDATVEGEEILFPHLENLSIDKCPKLTTLPKAPLLQEPCSISYRSAFPALKILKFGYLETFQRWDATVKGEEILFPLLEKLSIRKCPKLIGLPEAPLLQEPCSGGYKLIHSPFPLLENFFVRYYRKLATLPEAPLLQEPCSRSYRSAFPALKELNVLYLESFQRWDATVDGEEILFPLLEELSIVECPKLIALPDAPLLQEPYSGSYRSVFPALKVLIFRNLEKFQRWGTTVEGEEHILFPQLENLSIEKCPKLTTLPRAPLRQEPCSGGYGSVRSTFPALKVLGMEYLESFQRWDAAEETQGEHVSFPQLEKLSIQKCPKLIGLPEAPKLSVLEIAKCKLEVGHWVVRYLSSLTTLMLKLEDTETTSEADRSLIELVGSKKKWNQKSLLIVMKSTCCNSLFVSGALELWDYLVHLEKVEINRCDVLVNWPEKVFQSLVSLRKLVIRKCNNLTGYAQASLKPSATERSQHLPGLEFLCIQYCASLVEMFSVPASLKGMTIEYCNKLESIFGRQQLGMSDVVQGSSGSEAIVPTAVPELSSSPMNHFCPFLEDLVLSGCDKLSAVLYLPPSLKTIYICGCSSIQVLSCQLDELPKPQVTTSINVPEPSAAGHSLPPCLESLTIQFCAKLGGILCLPTSLKKLDIKNSGLTSLESLSGEPPSFQSLELVSCSTLASLPNEPQAYRSLWRLIIKDCPAIKKLPTCLQQRLGSIRHKYVDPHLEVMALQPKTWKKIPRLLLEQRRQAELSTWEAEDTRLSAKRMAEQRRQAILRTEE